MTQSGQQSVLSTACVTSFRENFVKPSSSHFDPEQTLDLAASLDLAGRESHRELRPEPVCCPHRLSRGTAVRMNGSIHGERTASEPQDRGIEVPSEIIQKWQEFVNLLAE